MGGLQALQITRLQSIWCEKTKPGNCPSCTGCVKHVEDIHYSLDPNTKAHWDNLEESKASKCRLETRYQGESMLDECVEEFRCRGAKTKKVHGKLGTLVHC